MAFNKEALQFIKIEAEYNKGEIFAIGNIFGMKAAFGNVIDKNTEEKLTEEEIQKTVDEIVTYEQVEKMWNKLGDKFELELRPFEETNIMLKEEK